MKVDLLPFESWENLNAQIKSTLGIDAQFEARAYVGLAAAVYEVAMSTAQFYSHKRSVAMVPGQTPYYQALLPYLYKEGYEVQFAKEPLEAKTWVESLKKDTNFVISCEDHPITGELFELEPLDLLLNEKKIFHLRISHHNHLFHKIDILPYSARLCAYNPKVALAIMGQKFKSPPLMAPAMDWSDPSFLRGITTTIGKSKEDGPAVKAFESRLPLGFKALLPQEKRIFDRSLIYSEEISGEALQQFIASQLKIEIQEPGWETEIETTNLCRWGGVRNYEMWWEPRPSEDILRGLLILSLNTIKHPEIHPCLKRSLVECQIEIG